MAKVKVLNEKINLTARVFKEGKMCVSHNPELNVASCGNTAEEATLNLRDAVSGFLKSANKLGTLEEILEEKAFTRVFVVWV